MHLQENLSRDSLKKISNIVKDQKTHKDDMQSSKKKWRISRSTLFYSAYKGKTIHIPTLLEYKKSMNEFVHLNKISISLKGEITVQHCFEDALIYSTIFRLKQKDVRCFLHDRCSMIDKKKELKIHERLKRKKEPPKQFHHAFTLLSHHREDSSSLQNGDWQRFGSVEPEKHFHLTRVAKILSM